MNKFLIIFLMFSSIVFSYEENNNLVIIQKVSNTKKTFIIRRGMKDKVFPGQRSLFTNGKVSLVAKVISSNRFFSQWQLEEDNIIVPFTRGQIVNFSYSVEKVWNEIPRLITQKRYDNILKVEKQRAEEKRDFLFGSRFQFLISATQGLGESTTGSENNEGERSGNQFKIDYIKPLNDTFRLLGGFRYDSDTLTLKAPEVEESTQRYMLTLGIQTRFPALWKLKPVPYLKFGAAYGKSQTTINDKTRSGSVFAIPTLAIGVDIKMSRKTNAIIEIGFESLSTSETFSDGVSQNTNINSAFASVGIQFQ